MHRFLAGTYLLLALTAGAAPGQPADSTITTPPAVRALVDSVVAAHVGPSGIPGAAVAIVEDQSVTLAAGYGHADRTTGVAVDPDSTLFNIGSVTKLVTSTAALQLVEAGRVDLHADVNQYLRDVRVPARFGQPVTLHHLLTHTPGFENRFLGVAADSPAAVQPLGPYLRRNLPARVRPPGKVASYSNHGMALAGHLVASVRDTSYAAAVRSHVFAPLGMTRTAASIRALPDTLRPYVATPHQGAGGAFAPLPPGAMHIVPAGGVYTTAKDAARFLLAHLNGGATPAGRILRPATVQEMHTQQFTHHPALAGWAYGFQEHPRSAPRILQHGGGGTGYTALLWLAPSRNVGVFVACNANDDALQTALFDALTTHFFGPAPEPPRPEQTAVPAPSGDASRWAGTYRHVRHAQSTPEKLLALTMQVEVAHTDAGLVAEGLASAPVRLLPAGHGRFRRADRGTVVFEKRADGSAFLFENAPGAPAYERISAWETIPVQGGLVAILGVVFLGAVVGVVWRGRHGTRALRVAWSLAGAAGTAALAFCAGFPVVVFTSSAGPVFFAGPTPALKVVLALPLLALIAAAGLVVQLARRWAGLPAGARAAFVVLVMAGGLFGAVLHTWNLLGWQF